MERLLGTLLISALAIGSCLLEAVGDMKAADLLRQARAALGGERALDDVRTLSATGSVTRAVSGGPRLDGDLTLQIELPDRMLRTDALSPDGGITLITEQGLNGRALLRNARTVNAPPGALIRTPPPPARGSDAEAQALRAARADMTRLVVALLLKPPGAVPVEFSYGGQAEAPDGKADVIDVKATDGSSFAARLFIDVETHRPLMLSYRGVSPRMVVQTRRLERGQRPRDIDPTGLPEPSAGDVVDIEMFLDDYRNVDGILLPHHMTRAVAGEVNEEWTLRTFSINQTFKTGTFDPK
jgi:hypothetical protein